MKRLLDWATGRRRYKDKGGAKDLLQKPFEQCRQRPQPQGINHDHVFAPGKITLNLLDDLTGGNALEIGPRAQHWKLKIGNGFPYRSR